MVQMVKYLQKLLESPIVGHLVTRDEKHRTLRKMFFSAAIMEESNQLVVYIPEAGMDGIRSNLQVSNYVAVLIIDVVTYEGVQMKGNATIRAATCSEEAYFEMMLQRLANHSYPDRIFKKQYKPLIALELNILEIYNQTPGTGAGERLRFD